MNLHRLNYSFKEYSIEDIVEDFGLCIITHGTVNDDIFVLGDHFF